MKKAVILFLIVPSEQKDFERSEQFNLLCDRAATMGFEIAGFFAVPQSQSNLGFTHAIDSCLTHHAKTILINDFTKCELKYKELRIFMAALLKNNISLMSDDDRCLSLDNLKIFSDLLESCALAETKTHSTRIKQSLKELSQQGYVLGAKKFGSTPQEMRIIKQILKLESQGKSLQEICHLLSKNNIKTTRNKKWYPTTVKRLIDRNKKE
ncbi:MAG: recombinase family protein [Myxococcales bacterium]|nr:recombinase family protein [Myxococcales bacterium]USN50074.1 MAG: recombinase family protein [Myxococcales bacterium]